MEQLQVNDYLDSVVSCMIERLNLDDESKIRRIMANDAAYIEQLFAEDAEIIFHDDPMRLATALAVRWKLSDRPKLVVRRPH